MKIKYPDLDYEELIQEAREVRLAIVEALHGNPTGGHYGGCLSVVEILLGLYRMVIQKGPEDLRGLRRDRLILSKGHSALTLYTILMRLGRITAELSEYGAFASPLEGHPDMTSVAGVDFSTGSLGQGLSVGAGMALALKNSCIWVVLGDGECQEGQVWEAAMFAAIYKLGNLRAVIDCNGLQECGWSFARPGLPLDPIPEMEAKWRVFGWDVITCEGHSFQELGESFKLAKRNTGRKPTAILAKTKKGKGSQMIEEAAARFHCTKVSDTEHEIIFRQIQKS